MSVTIQQYELPFEFGAELAALVNNSIASCDQADVEGFFLRSVLGLDDVEATVENDKITGVILRQLNSFDPTQGISSRFKAAMARLQEFLFSTTITPGML